MDARAAPSHAQILRRGGAGEGERKIPVDVQLILAGKGEDVPLRPNDILFIPNSAAKTITARTIEAALQLAIGMALVGRL
jgi:polysaccharide export outer membrane protein